MATFGLPRRARLLRQADFAALRGASERLSTRSFVAEYRPNSGNDARLGIAISRRVSKRAVVRNRIRRVIRESYRLHRAGLPRLDILLIARMQAADTANPLLRADLESIWGRLLGLQRSEH